MTTTTPTRIGKFYTRAQAARILADALGDSQDWHKMLTCTTERTRDYLGYMHSGILLIPSCILGNQPYYEKNEVAAFIKTMQTAFPYLKPSPIKPKELAVPCIDMRTIPCLDRHGFRLNPAKKV